MTAHRLFAPRWLTTGGAVLLAGVVGVAFLLNHGDPACAAAGAKATFYDLGDGTGHCSFAEAPDDDLFVALGDATYQDAAACGSYLDVVGPNGKVRVKVIDSCPECDANHLDLSRTAFKQIADEIDGVVPISFTKVRLPSVPGPLSVRLKEGSSQYWFAALIDNHANPLASVEVSSEGGEFTSATRADYNYWLIDGGAGSGPFTIKISDVYGKTSTLTGITMSPGETQSGPVTRVAAPKPVLKKPAVAKRKPAPKKASPVPSKSSPVVESAALSPTNTPATEPPALAAKVCG